jgi:transcriptional regulator with XRE-family HTH domain
MDGAGFRGRLFLAWSLWQVRHQRKLTQGELGEMVGKAGGVPVAQNTVSGWFRSAMPDVHDIEYLAKALEVDPGWLAFGEASTAQPPDDPSKPIPMPRPKPKG